MRSGNPTLKDSTFKKYAGQSYHETMTLQGTVNKTFIMLILLMGSAFFTWKMYFTDGNIMPYLWGGLIGGFIVALITCFVPKFSPVSAPIYAILEGFVVGGVSALYETKYPGIALQAVMLTFSILIGLLFAYKSRLVQATENFKLGVIAATMGIAIVYLINMGLSFFGMSVPYLHDSGPVGIGISLFIVVIASLNLVLDFDFIENGVKYGSPKYMEWYGAFGLIVTLVWLYFEILRLLSKLRK